MLVGFFVAEQIKKLPCTLVCQFIMYPHTAKTNPDAHKRSARNPTFENVMMLTVISNLEKCKFKFRVTLEIINVNKINRP